MSDNGYASGANEARGLVRLAVFMPLLLFLGLAVLLGIGLK